MPTRPPLPKLLQLQPEYRDYVWGGERLRPGSAPTAEAWVIYAENRIAGGRLHGRTLAQAAQTYGIELLGRLPWQRTGSRFPLLIKLLDCAQWLSLQVHPNDEQALRLEGEGYFGKTEAWHILEAAPGAQLIAGCQTGVAPAALAEAVRRGAALDIAQRLTVQGGDTLFMPPGTLHALGPGLLIYEVQQTSDLTYRVYDWGRPETPARPLHLEKSLAALDAARRVEVKPAPRPEDGTRQTLVSCPYFTLEWLSARPAAHALDTAGETFHALTVIAGGATLEAGTERLELAQYHSALVTAAAGAYRLLPREGCRLLKASVEALPPA